ncbi:MAG: hypothetical protein IIZ23_01910 [Ruminococcus sp.]|nr:hypothetical protein [Ruminococcus sp.]
MKQKLRILLVILTGLLFTVYSAYNVFVIIKDYKELALEDMLVLSFVVLLFGVFAFFAFTAEVKSFRFLVMRRLAFISAFMAMFLLKLRMLDKVVAYFDITKPDSVMYYCAYIATQVALLILAIYYAFIRQNLPHHRKASVILPLTAMLLFICSFVMEGMLYFMYNIGLEANELRTLVIRPVFYMAFILLSAYFLFPPELDTGLDYMAPDDSEMISADDVDSLPSEGSEYLPPDNSELVAPVDADDLPFGNPVYVEQNRNDFIAADGIEEIPLEDTAFAKQNRVDFIAAGSFDDTPMEESASAMHNREDFIMPNNEEYIPNMDPEFFKPGRREFIAPDDDEEYVAPIDPEYTNQKGTELI